MSDAAEPPEDTAQDAGGHPTRLGRVKAGLGRAWRLILTAFTGFSRHHGTQLAASMSYYALFSVFPAAIVAAGGAGFFLDDPSAQTDAVDYLTQELPLSSDQGRSDLEEIIQDVVNNSGRLGLIGVVGLLISASALMSAARNSLNIIFGGETTRGALRGKALDIGLILFVGALFALSFGATLFAQLDIELTGRVGEAIGSVLTTTGFFLPVAVAAIIFSILFRLLPAERRGLRDLWPGALFAAIGYEVLKRGFSVYLENFADYSAVYGSLGAVIAFMFFIYLAGIVFLLGAEMASVWPGVRAGLYDPDPDDDDDRGFRRKALDLLKGLVSRSEVDQPRTSGPPRP